MGYEKFLPAAKVIAKMGGGLIKKVMDNDIACKDMYLRYGLKGIAVTVTGAVAALAIHEFFETSRYGMDRNQETNLGIKKEDGSTSLMYSTKKKD